VTILRHYSLQAAEGREAELGEALAALAALVRGCEGCEKVEIFTEAGDTRRYVFIEHWHSKDARDSAGAALGKAAFASVFAALGEKPEARDLLPVQR
jgi:quinol monooxygenase YgiN